MLLRRMMLTVACVMVFGASAQALPVVLFDDTASQTFGNPASSSNTDPYSGTSSWLVQHSGWGTSGFELGDGQATTNDVLNNDVSVWYRTDLPSKLKLSMSTWDGGVVTFTDQLTVDTVGDGEWHELLLDFSDNGSGVDETVNRTMRLHVQNWTIPGNPGASVARDIYYDLVTVTPEPASMALLGLGGLVMLRRRR